MSLPIPNLDDKTFNELFEEARALIPRYAPEWTDHNFSDPGITLIDLFAWLTEMQIYSLNRINDRNKLKFLRLLGDMPRAAKPSRVNLVFRVDEQNVTPVLIPGGTPVAAVDPSSGEQLVYETDSQLMASNIRIAQVLTHGQRGFIDQTNANADNGLFYFAFGDKAARDSRLYIGFDAPRGFPRAKITLWINPFEADLPPVPQGAKHERPEVAPSAELNWEFWGGTTWQPLEVTDDTAVLVRSGSITFDGTSNFAELPVSSITNGVPSVNAGALYWIRAIVRKPGYEIPPRLESIWVNSISATHGWTIRDEYIAKERIERKGLLGQTAELEHNPVLNRTLELKIFEDDEKWHPWIAVPDFDASAPGDRHYTIDLQAGRITFGDGINGRVPMSGEREGGAIWATRYKTGGGEKGNIRARTVQGILAQDIKGVTVENPFPASGGVEAESMDEAQQRLRKDLKIPYRAVNSNDFQELAFKTPGLRLARVQVLPLYHPDYPAIRMPGTVTVVVVPHTLPSSIPGVPTPSEGFLKTVASFLERRRLISTRLHVIGPRFIRVDIETGVSAEPLKSIETLKLSIEDALRKFIDPIQGGPEYNGWPFGRSVYKSEIYQVLKGVEGVRTVESLTLEADSRPSQDDGNISIPRIGLVYLGHALIKVNGKGQA